MFYVRLAGRLTREKMRRIVFLRQTADYFMTNEMKGNTMQSQNLTRRQLLQTAAGAGVVVALTGCSADPQPTSAMVAPTTTSSQSLDLNGDTWNMHEEGTAEVISAIVPGATYTDLMRAKKIPDPYYRENNGRGARGG